MCSVLGILDIKSDIDQLRKQALQMSKIQRHRGPDWSGIFVNEKAILAHERLAIVDIEHGAQPLYCKDRKLVLSINGEIYNHKELEKVLTTSYEFQTESDC
jgi:asparagine synthase (glutamine-hydrolysing)